jgi:regulator of RNase E activity RraA
MQEIITGLAQYDTATVFNALVMKLGLPNEEYTDHHLRCLLPELGSVVGYAATVEVTTNDPDSPGLDWSDYYAYLESQPGPLVAVFKDVDSRPGRGASFGDGMARLHRRLGVVGVLVDGTIRDLAGIRQVGLPIWAWGTVPGHGLFQATRMGAPLTVNQLRVRPGDLLMADGDGCVRIPVEHAADVLRLAGEVQVKEQAIFDFYAAPDFSVARMREQKWS